MSLHKFNGVKLVYINVALITNVKARSDSFGLWKFIYLSDFI